MLDYEALSIVFGDFCSICGSPRHPSGAMYLCNEELAWLLDITLIPTIGVQM